jgi:DNA (cytosine-5)-methyltransferase 1
MAVPPPVGAVDGRRGRVLTPTRVLDLFCGAGGAAMGLHRAWPGAEIVGVDIKHQPRYPFRFVQDDVLGFAVAGMISAFDFVWASPMCQHYAAIAYHGRKRGIKYPDQISDTRNLLLASGVPWVIENVPGSPLHYPTMLCGAMFPPMRTYRHRLFESSFRWEPLPHPKHVVRTMAKQLRRKEHFFKSGMFVSVAGDAGREVSAIAMCIDWMTGDEMSKAVPPAYSEYIARQLSAL